MSDYTSSIASDINALINVHYLTHSDDNRIFSTGQEESLKISQQFRNSLTIIQAASSSGMIKDTRLMEPSHPVWYILIRVAHRINLIAILIEKRKRPFNSSLIKLLERVPILSSNRFLIEAAL